VKQFNKGVQATLQQFDEKENQEVLETYKTLLEEFKRFFRQLKSDEEFKDAMAYMTAFQHCLKKKKATKK
jgi:hypothetical protein